jgi:hypothetical protein
MPLLSVVFVRVLRSIIVDCVWSVMAHAQKPEFVLLRLKCDDTCAETRIRLTAFEMWWHIRRNQNSSYCVWNVMAHAQKPEFVLLRLKCDGTSAETRFRLSVKRTSPFISAGASVQSTTDRRCVCISGSNVGYTMFRGSMKSTATHYIRQFPLRFPSLASPCAITFQLDSTNSKWAIFGLWQYCIQWGI